MTWIVYVGSATAVDIPATRQQATRGVPIDVASDVASELLAQASWEPGDPGPGGTVSVQVSGQQLVLTAATVGGSPVTLYSDSGTSTAVTLPVTVTADTTYYLADDTEGVLSLAVSWASGIVLAPVTGGVRNGKDLVVRPWPTTEQIAAGASVAGGSATIDGGTP